MHRQNSALDYYTAPLEISCAARKFPLSDYWSERQSGLIASWTESLRSLSGAMTFLPATHSHHCRSGSSASDCLSFAARTLFVSHCLSQSKLHIAPHCHSSHHIANSNLTHFQSVRTYPAPASESAVSIITSRLALTSPQATTA